MKLNEATRLLENNGYIVYKPQLMMNEGIFDAAKALKKIGSLLFGWKKEMASAKKEGDEEKQEEIANKAKQLKAEVEDNKLFCGSIPVKARQIVMAGIIALMTMGAANAHAGTVPDNFGGSDGNSPVLMGGGHGGDPYGDLNNALKLCKDPNSCHISMSGDGSHTATVGDSGDSGDSGKNITGDDGSSSEKSMAWKLTKFNRGADGGFIAILDVDADGNGSPDHIAKVHVNSDGSIDDGLVKRISMGAHGDAITTVKYSADTIKTSFHNIDKMAMQIHNHINK